MTVYRTVGVGGDHADWSAAWIYLCGIDPLGDDYEFEQISDCTINNTWPDITIAANQVNLNGHYIKFYCPWANSHQGDPTKGYKTYLNGANGGMLFVTPNVAQSYLIDKIYVENLNIEQISNNGIYCLTAYPTIVGNQYTITFDIKYCLIKGFSTGVSTGIYTPHKDSLYYVSNCKIWNISTGINATQGAGGGLAVVNPGTRSLIENCTVYDTGNATRAIQPRNGALNVRNLDFRNVVSCGSSTNRSWNQTITNENYLYNCADDDNSIGIAVAAGFLNAVDCVTNITPADEFQSLVDTNPNFLKLNDGTVT